MTAEQRAYCAYCRQAVPLTAWLARERICRACIRAHARAWQHQRAGRPVHPPAGYIRLSVAAARSGYSCSEFSRRIRLGWMAGRVWQRGPRCAWYIEDRAVYPPAAE